MKQALNIFYHEFSLILQKNESNKMFLRIIKMSHLRQGLVIDHS